MATLSEYYQNDHTRLDELFNEFEESKQVSYELALEIFKEFKAGLLLHICWEEEILFPLFEEKTGMRLNGPTAVMRHEHNQIKGLLIIIETKLTRYDLNIFEDEDLISLLADHNIKEENILYPMLDQHITEEERVLVFNKMSAVKNQQQPL